MDTSQLDQWDQVVSGPAVNAVDHLLKGTLPDVQINHDSWEEQSISYQYEKNRLSLEGIKSLNVLFAIRSLSEKNNGNSILEVVFTNVM